MNEHLKREIHEAYQFLRERNRTISDETLDFMKNAALNAINEQPLDLVGISEIAKLARTSKSAVSNWVKRHSNFPKPLVKLAAGPIWRRQDVDKWLRNPDNPLYGKAPETVNFPSLNEIYKAAQVCTEDKNPDNWEWKGLRHIKGWCTCSHK